jgi:hypothetical protein
MLVVFAVMFLMSGVGNALQIAAVDYIGQGNVGIYEWAVRGDGGCQWEPKTVPIMGF